MKIRIFGQLALATGLVFFGAARASTTMYAVNGNGGISGFNTTTGAQVFSTANLGLPPMISNLALGSDGYLYADTDGRQSFFADSDGKWTEYSPPILKINTSNGQVSSLGANPYGKLVFGSNNTLYSMNSSGSVSGFNTTTGAQVFNSGGIFMSPGDRNLSFGPDGYLYANGGGAGLMLKINTSSGQVTPFGPVNTGEFVFGSNNTLYTINYSGGVSGYNTATGSQVFSTAGLGLDPKYGNLSFGPDGLLYADGGGSGANIYKIKLNGQVTAFSYLSNSSGEFVFGSNNTLYAINNLGGIFGYNTATGAVVFNTINLGLNPLYGNLSLGPDGYLYANGGGYGPQIFKINTSNGQVTPFDADSLSSGEFVFATSVPEVDTWGMLLVGLGLIGVAARRRKLAIV